MARRSSGVASAGRAFSARSGPAPWRWGQPAAWALASAEGAARLATSHGRAGINTQHFGRIFERMHPFAVPGKKGLEAALVDIGSPGGILDARDALDRGPVDLIADLSLSAHNPNNPTHTAGATFFGQFMDHDMTFDLASPLGKPSGAAGLSERAHAVIRSRFGLRGRARSASPQLYDPARPREAEGRVGRPVRRRAAGMPRRHARSSPIPATTRHVIISGLQAAFLLLPQPRRRSAASGRHQPNSSRRRSSRRLGG